MTTLNLQVGASAGDAAEVTTDGPMLLTEAVLDFGKFGAITGRHIGLHFTGVSGLSGVTIGTCTLTFRAFSTDSGGFVGDWYAHDVAAPGVFTTTNFNITDTGQRPRTTATCEGDGSDFGNWTSGADPTFTGDGVNFLKDIIQELADSYDPSAIALLHIFDSGSGERRARSWDYNTSLAPKLDIDYTAAPAGVTITVPVATLTTSLFAPVVKLVVIPPTRTLSLATFTLVLGLSVIPPPLSLSLSAFAPTVTTTANVVITPPVLALSLSEFAPIVSVTDNQLVTPPTLVLSLSAFAPTVSTPVVVTPPVVALSLTAFVPTVTVSADVTVTPPTLALSVAAFAPTITATDNQLVTPPVQTLSLTVFAPTVTVTGDVTVTVPVVALTLSAFAPTVSTPVIVTPGVLGLNLSAFAPAIAITDNQLVTPGVVALTLSAFAPAISTPVTVTPGVRALILAAFTPTISVSSAFTAVWLDTGSVAILLVLDGSVSLPGAVNDGTISIKQAEDATV